MCDTVISEPIQKIQKEIPSWQKRDTVFAVIPLISSVLFVDWSVFGGFNAGFTASLLLLYALTFAYNGGKSRHIGAFSVFCAAASVGFSAIFSVYNDSLMNLIFFAAAVILYGISVAGIFGGDKNSSPMLSILNTLLVNPFDKMDIPFRSYGSYRRENKLRGVNRQVLAGILLSVPVLVVIFPLLMRSDAAFEGLIVSVFSGVGMLILKILLGAAASVYFFSMLFSVKKNLKHECTDIGSTEELRKIPPATAVTLSSVLAAVYFVYLLSQSAYFFSGFSGILPKGYAFTPADYARRGFFELCGVCGINFVTVSVIFNFTKRGENAAAPLSVRIMSTVICIFSLIFAATAISKMIMYIGFFGLTRLRLMTSIFMAALALLFIIITVSMYAKRFPAMKCVIICFAAIGLITGFCDIDRTVASYNVNAFTSGVLKELDIDYLGELSDSVVPYIAQLTKSDNESVRDAAYHALYERAERLFEMNGDKISLKTDDSPSKYNYSRENARQIIQKDIKQIVWKESERVRAEEEQVWIY